MPTFNHVHKKGGEDLNVDAAMSGQLSKNRQLNHPPIRIKIILLKIFLVSLNINVSILIVRLETQDVERRPYDNCLNYMQF